MVVYIRKGGTEPGLQAVWYFFLKNRNNFTKTRRRFLFGKNSPELVLVLFLLITPNP